MVVTDINAEAAGKIRIGSFNVNRIGYGAMRITGAGVWGEPEDMDNATDLLKSCAEMGINFIDTADAYGPEVSENIIREALFPYTGLVVATKGGLTRSGPGIWNPDCSPDHLRQACEDSLRRLKVEAIDVYQLHTVDPKVPFEDSFGTLLDLQREGKVKHIGLSNIEPDNFAQAINMGHFVSVQNNYNVFNREHEDVLKLCEQHGIAFIPYFPVGGNLPDGPSNEMMWKIAHKYEATTHQIALAWLLAHSPNILPIPGTSSIKHLSENIASAVIRLEKEDITLLNGLSSHIG